MLTGRHLSLDSNNWFYHSTICCSSNIQQLELLQRQKGIWIPSFLKLCLVWPYSLEMGHQLVGRKEGVGEWLPGKLKNICGPEFCWFFWLCLEHLNRIWMSKSPIFIHGATYHRNIELHRVVGVRWSVDWLIDSFIWQIFMSHLLFVNNILRTSNTTVSKNKRSLSSRDSLSSW